VALKRRAQAAGIDGFHLHLLRHTAATRWLRAGGSEAGLMPMPLTLASLQFSAI
jgi:integrase